MLSKLNLEHIVFLDIETVPEVQNFTDLSADKQELWTQKSQYSVKMNLQLKNFILVRGFGPNLAKSSVFLSVILRLTKMLEHLESRPFLEKNSIF